LRKKMMSLNGVYSGASTRPVETTRETPQIEGDDIVRTVQQCTESGRNDLTICEIEKK
jgi:hypothetical protein